MMGGGVFVVSQPGEGSTFTIIIPTKLADHTIKKQLKACIRVNAAA